MIGPFFLKTMSKIKLGLTQMNMFYFVFKVICHTIGMICIMQFQSK